MAHISYKVLLKISETPVAVTDEPLSILHQTGGSTNLLYLRIDNEQRRIISDENIDLRANGELQTILHVNRLFGYIIAYDFGSPASYTLDYKYVPNKPIADVVNHYINCVSDDIDVSVYGKGFKQYKQGYSKVQIGVAGLKYLENDLELYENSPILFEYKDPGENIIRRGFVQLLGVEQEGSIFEREEFSYIAEITETKDNWGNLYGWDLEYLDEVPLQTWEILPIVWGQWLLWE